MRIPSPLLVFQEFLSHEQLRNPGCSEQDTHRKTCPAGRIPRALVRGIGQRGDTVLLAYFDDVMIFNARTSLPTVRQSSGWRLSAILSKLSSPVRRK